MAHRTDHPLVVIGSGPGIGRHVAQNFASNRFNKVALVSRSASKLAEDQVAVEAAVDRVEVKTYTADITDEKSYTEILEKIGRDLGSPECVLFNAARVAPTKLLDTAEEEMLYDFKTTCTALHTTSKWAMPQLVALAKADASTKPSLLVTSSLLPQDPIPELFVLSMVKAAQRNMVQSMAKTYGQHGVHVAVIAVGGQVDPSHETLNPAAIASSTWGLFAEPRDQQSFEIVLH